MGRGDHRSGAEDEPQLLVESVGVGVAGVGAGDDFGGHRGSAEDELDARGVGEVGDELMRRGRQRGSPVAGVEDELGAASPG